MGFLKNMSRTNRSTLITYALVIVAFLLIQGLVAAGAITYSMQGLLVPITCYVVMAVSLNLVVGISGELSLGHAGFMSIGAFSGIVVMAQLAGTIPDPVARLVVTIFVSGLLAAVAGVLIGIPVMRLHGDYLAIVTLAFGEIIKNVLNNLYVGLDASGLHFSMTDAQGLHMNQGTILINGPQGAAGITVVSTFTLGFLLVLLCLFVVLNLKNSRSGRAIMAVRDNRIAAESAGINVTKYRLMAFVVAAALAGMAGALYAMNYSSIVPKKFDYNLSILVLVFVVLGGLGNVRGSIISAAALTILPEALRAIADYRMLLYAIVLIMVMLVSNNPQIKGFFSRFVSKFRRHGDNDGVVAEGGDRLD